jgi:hypothetical protein
VKLLERIANWVDFGVSLLCAVFLVLFAVEVHAGRILAPSSALKTPKGVIVAVAIGIAALLVVGAVFRAWRHVVRSSRCRYLVYETPNGRVSIRTRSVETALNRAVRSVFDVADSRTAVSVPRGATVPTEVRVRCRLYDRPNLLASQDQVRAAVRQRYHELFPGEESLPVEVLVENIIFQAPPTRLPPKPTPEPDTEEEEDTEPGPPLRPQYPVG